MATYTFDKTSDPGTMRIYKDGVLHESLNASELETSVYDGFVRVSSGTKEVEIAIAEVTAATTEQDILDAIATGTSGVAIKKYIALMTQSGSSAPVATVLENTIGTIVWTRTSAGNYVGTLTAAFTANKTHLSPLNQGVYGMVRIGANSVALTSAADGDITEAPIEIKVYK